MTQDMWREAIKERFAHHLLRAQTQEMVAKDPASLREDAGNSSNALTKDGFSPEKIPQIIKSVGENIGLKALYLVKTINDPAYGELVENLYIMCFREGYAHAQHKEVLKKKYGEKGLDIFQKLRTQLAEMNSQDVEKKKKDVDILFEFKKAAHFDGIITAELSDDDLFDSKMTPS